MARLEGLSERLLNVDSWAELLEDSGIPTVDKPEPQFRSQFINVLAEQIGRYFYDHDSTVDFASDSTVPIETAPAIL